MKPTQPNAHTSRIAGWIGALMLAFPGLLNSAHEHQFKMSVCEIVYAPQRRAFDVKCYLFQDDLRETLYNDPANGLLTADPVSNYILRHLELTVNGQNQALTFRELHTKDDQVLVQFSTNALPTSIPTINQLDVKNNLMTDKFSNQVNMVYVYYPTEQSKHTKLFDAQKTQAIFEL